MGRWHEDGRWFSLLKSLALCSSWSQKLHKASVRPHWFADVVFPTRTRLVILFESSVAQRRISQLLALSHSRYKPGTSKGQLKGNICREKREKGKEKRKRLSAFPFFSVHDITGLRCFGITALSGLFFTSYFTKTIKNPPKKTGSEEENSCVMLSS